MIKISVQINEQWNKSFNPSKEKKNKIKIREEDNLNYYIKRINLSPCPTLSQK